MGSLIHGIKTPTLEISATNCSMFNITEIPIEDMSNSNIPEVPFQLLERPFEYEDIYRMSYTIFPIIGMVSTMVLSILASLATGGMASNAEDLQNYIHPLAWRLFNLDVFIFRKLTLWCRKSSNAHEFEFPTKTAIQTDQKDNKLKEELRI